MSDEADTAMADAPVAVSDPITTSTKKSKKKPYPSVGTSVPFQRVTHRNPPYTYFPLAPHFSPSLPSSVPQPDLLTIRSYINSAFRQFHGIAGTAIDVDILHSYSEDEGNKKKGTLLVRIPTKDVSMALVALGGWTAEVDLGGKRNVGFKIGGTSGTVQGVVGAGQDGIWG
ncbi:hypothetical protein BJ508DRAFT_414282 [Ascobolus immersus RN42]|uniref:Ribonucleases P/MRP subunit Pop8-like domain-containing protein n=1 Tax=Ascobolus immersus RN42 TaxID=1160509 RepID=A0A3N4I839_ASCIM|nr:hypothetical protein BJ508DRAFT_414282 [Ascobolus immersus RN42]